MALLEEFVGGMYQASSPTLGADMAVNVYLETRRVEGSPKQKWLLGTPGLRLLVTASTSGCRGWFEQDELTIVVVGDTIYSEIAGFITSLGTIPDNGEPVSISSNGQGGDQIAIVGGGELKILDRITLALSAAITLPFSDPVMIVFLQAYFIINQRNSPICWFSALEDGTAWDALDFFTRSGTADNIVGIGVAEDRIWAFGVKTSNQFYNSGDADTPFLPYPGTTSQIGAVSPWAIARRNDQFTWVAHDAEGQLTVVKARGTISQQAISTPPIEDWLRRCPTLDGIEMLAYQQTGHAFVAVTAPTSSDDIKTYVWDDVEGVWHARAGWDSTTGRFTRWRARGVIQRDSAVLVGDYATGDLYLLDPDTYDDNGAVLRAVRRTPYVSSGNQWIFVDQLELAAQVGVGLSTGQGSAPVADLRISRDAAQTWISAGAASLGSIGANLVRTVWRRLGRVRADRLVIEVSQSDPVKRAWFGLWLRPTAGSGEL